MNKKVKNILLIILLLVVLGMTIGYAALTQVLNINGTANITTFDVDLLYPGASATYIITVQNSGTIDAKLESITGIDTANTSAPTEIKYSINATENEILAKGDSKEYTVTVKWEDSNAIPETKTKSTTITLNYVQAI